MNDALIEGLRQAAMPIHHPVRRAVVWPNGTDPRLMREAIVAAMEAVRDAVERLQETRPNARDYTPGDMLLAHHAHASRLARLASVQGELDLLFQEWER